MKKYVVLQGELVNACRVCNERVYDSLKEAEEVAKEKALYNDGCFVVAELVSSFRRYYSVERVGV